MLNTNEIFNLTEKLELKGTNHPLLESAMLYTFGIDWEKNELYKEFYQYAKEALYFDTDCNTWLVK